jgi:hypothetical protein
MFSIFTYNTPSVLIVSGNFVLVKLPEILRSHYTNICFDDKLSKKQIRVKCGEKFPAMSYHRVVFGMTIPRKKISFSAFTQFF